MRALNGRTVVLLEGRKGEEVAAMVRELGGRPSRILAVREVVSAEEAGPCSMD